MSQHPNQPFPGGPQQPHHQQVPHQQPHQQVPPQPPHQQVPPQGGTGAAAVEPPLSEADLSYQRYRAEDRSLGEIASDVLGNASTLVRQEIALARAEIKESVNRTTKGAAFYAGAGVVGLLALIALTIAMCWGFGALTNSMVWGSIITMVIWVIVAVVLFFLGKSEFDKIRGLEQTQETISKIPNAAMGNEEKNQ